MKSQESGSFETLLIEQPREFVRVITLNRPQVANAFNTLMATELMTWFEALALNHDGVRCVIVTGAGERAFCAGGDLKERNGMTNDAWEKQHRIFERMTRAVIDCPVPVIAAVNGAAFGGGCELACAMDFIYASDSARFAMPETSLGIIPGAGGTQTLSRAVGERRAKELLLSGKAFNASQAHDWGLANAVFPPDILMESSLEIAEKIAGNAPIAVRQAKQAIHRGLQMSLSDGLGFEIEAYNRTVPTEDRQEGVRAYNEKRPPEFKGK
ncbi:MAG: enoyl-CoA hydratase-related protein [Pseudomonadota bacterium]